MKKWYLAAIILLLLATTVTAVTYRPQQALGVPTIDEVVSADFSEGRPLTPSDQTAQHLIAVRARDRAVITQVLGWLQSAKVVGKGAEPMPNIGVHTFGLHLTNNREVTLAFAGYPTSDLLVYTSEAGPTPFHVDSSPLKSWMRDGWKQDIELGPWGQRAVDAVFQSIDTVAMPIFQKFPRAAGSRDGVINIGGPPPGTTIQATFETSVSDSGSGKFQVQFTRRWGNAATVWTFLVDGDGVVHDQGRTGDDPPAIP